MLELGPGEEEAHREVGERAAEVADWLVVAGVRSAWIAEAAERRGFPPDHVLRATTNAEAIHAVRTILRTEESTMTPEEDPTASTGAPLDSAWAVLVKGSRGMRMEEVVEGLKGA